MISRLTLAGLSAVVVIICGCTANSDSVSPVQGNENQAAADDGCDEVIATADEWGSLYKSMLKTLDEMVVPDRTRDELYAYMDLVDEQQDLYSRIIYIVADNPQCFSPGEVAEARVLRDELLNPSGPPLPTTLDP